MKSQRDLFLEARKGKIGGSTVGSLYNLDFGCRRATWYDFREVPQDFPKAETPEMERGTYIEPCVRALYEAKTGRKVKLLPQAIHPEHHWMSVNVDGETEAPEHAGPGYVEFKCVNRFVMKKFKKEGIRDSYILQLQHGMAVKNYSWGSYGILCLDPWEFLWFDKDRDEDLIAKLIEDENDFMVQVENGPMPDALEKVTDKRCSTCPWRRTCRGEEFLVSLPDSDQDTEVPVVDETLAPLVVEVAEAKELVSEAKGLEEDVVTRLKEAIGKRYGVIVPGYRALYPTSYPERWDTKALEGLQAEAKKLLATEADAWDYDALESRCTELLQVIIGLSKAKKTPKPERSLRIYATGD